MTDIVNETPVRQAPKRRLPDFGRRNEKIVAGLSIAPGQLLMFFIVAFPAAVAIYIGFTEWTPTSGDNARWRDVSPTIANGMNATWRTSTP